MSNRSVREGVVKVGHQARVSGVDVLAYRAAQLPLGIVTESILMDRADARDLDDWMQTPATTWFRLLAHKHASADSMAFGYGKRDVSMFDSVYINAALRSFKNRRKCKKSC